MLRRIGSLAAGVSLGLALAACGGTSGSRTRANTLIVLDRSIGGVSLRERRLEVEHVLGRGVVLHTSDQKPPEPRLHFEDVLYSNGLEIGYVSGDATPRSRARGQVIILLTRSPRFRTPQGVHVGSTAAGLGSINGVKCGNLANVECQHGGHVHNQPGTLFRLSGPGGVVVSISIAYSD
jgi:hypothetical protein